MRCIHLMPHCSTMCLSLFSSNHPKLNLASPWEMIGSIFCSCVAIWKTSIQSSCKSSRNCKDGWNLQVLDQILFVLLSLIRCYLAFLITLVTQRHPELSSTMYFSWCHALLHCTGIRNKAFSRFNRSPLLADELLVLCGGWHAQWLQCKSFSLPSFKKAKIALLPSRYVMKTANETKKQEHLSGLFLL